MDAKQVWDIQDEARMVRNRFKLLLLKGLLKLVEEAAPDAECKTIGNGNPAGLHCFACTFHDIKERVRRAVGFWEKNDQYKKALS